MQESSDEKWHTCYFCHEKCEADCQNHPYPGRGLHDDLWIWLRLAVNQRKGRMRIYRERSTLLWVLQAETHATLPSSDLFKNTYVRPGDQFWCTTICHYRQMSYNVHAIMDMHGNSNLLYTSRRSTWWPEVAPESRKQGHEAGRSFVKSYVTATECRSLHPKGMTLKNSESLRWAISRNSYPRIAKSLVSLRKMQNGGRYWSRLSMVKDGENIRFPLLR